jgi:hypothetical protein
MGVFRMLTFNVEIAFELPPAAAEVGVTQRCVIQRSCLQTWRRVLSTA